MDKDYPFVVQISATEDGSLKSTFYNLSGELGGSPGFSTVFDGSLLKLDLDFATYEGTLNADGTSIVGRWRQSADAQSMIFLRANAATAWTIPQPPPRPAPMAADADPQFEAVDGHDQICANLSAARAMGWSSKVFQAEAPKPLALFLWSNCLK